MSIIEVDSVELIINGQSILSNVYMKCVTGSITGLFGRNGQGKSCLLNIIYGTQKALNKSVRVNNKSIDKAYLHPAIVRYLPQFNFMPKYLTIKEIFVDFDIRYDVFFDYFPEFKEFSNSKLGCLSSGQRRLIEVYVIVKSKSMFVLLDEPFLYLMPLYIEKFLQIFKDEANNKGIIVTDHQFTAVTSISDSLYLLDNGKVHKLKTQNDLAYFGYKMF